MESFTALLQQGAAHAWWFIPTAILLGALHGLEPGHSKTMMAAFIIAVHGTVTQAILLGLSATISHTAIVWGVALGGMHLWKDMNAETAEPYFQLLSGIIILSVALWMFWRTWRSTHHHHDGHDHDHVHCGHDHSHDIETRFSSGKATNGQVILFGLTGGLIPCPAAITVLLLCLQLKEIPLGATLVMCFSVGLALTLVSVGVAAALSLKHAAEKHTGINEFLHKTPFFSAILMALVGLYMTIHGWLGIFG